MILLAVDSSSKACSCALFDGEKLLSECYINSGLTHSATLMPLIEDCLSHVNRTLAEVERYAVSIGPGSYTGLRIGIAAVKGMAFAGNIPCVGVSTLASLAYGLTDCEGMACAVLDARVGQVFTAIFEIKDGKVTRITEDGALTLEKLGEILPDNAIAVGDGAILLKESFPTKNIKPAAEAVRFQRASSVGRAALSGEGIICSPDRLLPNYHRQSQAEREREERLMNNENSSSK